MNFYHDLITEKSWMKLQELRRSFKFVLIGGWAVYLYTKGLKSRDIDFICDFNELQKLRSSFELIKNERLKKYEIHAGEFDIDIYVPFFSDLGIAVEDLMHMTSNVEGFTLLQPEPLLILKQKAFSDRALSAKGEKDRLDIISLLKAGVNLKTYASLLKKYALTRYTDQIKKIFSEMREAPELGISAHSFSKLKNDIIRGL